MRIPFVIGAVIALLSVDASAGLRGQLDYPEQRLPMNQATILPATLVNDSSSTLYLNGITVDLSHNAASSLYKRDLLQIQLRTLGPQQSWDGPLIIITPGHRGPLWVEGSITIQGGLLVASTGTLLSIPVSVPIDDARRNADGSWIRGTAAQCDRPSGSCCIGEESSCFQKGTHCVYVADGFNQERLCREGAPQKVYDRLSDVQTSNDGAHVAYIANDRCSTSGLGQNCRRQIVLDNGIQPSTGVPTQLTLSPDGRHLIWIERDVCIHRLDRDECTGAAKAVVDGAIGSAFEMIDESEFSADSHHWAYRAGSHCRAPTTPGQSSELVCRQIRYMVDGQLDARPPDWYRPL